MAAAARRWSHEFFRIEMHRAIDSIAYLEARGMFNELPPWLEALDEFIRRDTEIALKQENGAGQ